ncbi:DUF2721 domain-containing protein [Erysipelothrix urinaevulpis]|uniref:DUF2721 domain-containing protein n=1 Tax=Erysipelothrix urinaevulpis TaxID=2683717 RepID=UPI00135C5B89|nr:DUF2721 domain-containing protein [Erysipelothrix urinaevulpis]
MKFIFDFSLTTPALIFPAISLLMLAYTNRFVVLADLIRNLYNEHRQNPRQENLDQIANLKYRMDVIKKMQIFGASSFIAAVSSMLVALIQQPWLAGILFTASLVLLIISLAYLLKELSISIDALTIQLNDISDQDIES